MISCMVGRNKAAIYSVAYQISMVLNIIVVAVNNTFVPYTYKELKKGEVDNVGKIANILLMIFAAIIAVIILVGPEIIKIFAPIEYYEAIWLVPLASHSQAPD